MDLVGFHYSRKAIAVTMMNPRHRNDTFRDDFTATGHSIRGDRGGRRGPAILVRSALSSQRQFGNVAGLGVRAGTSGMGSCGLPRVPTSGLRRAAEAAQAGP